MLKTIKLETEVVEYTFKISTRAKQVRLTVSLGGEVTLTVPERLWKRLDEGFIVKMLQTRSKWILAKIEHFKVLQSEVDSGQIIIKKVSQKDERLRYLKYKEIARRIAEERVQYFNKFYGFKIGRISIKNTKTRWGSCSRKGNLNFNYKIALLPSKHADYIVVHELCHIGQFNHSKKFWSLVEKTVPDYDTIHNELKHSYLRFS